MSNPLPLFALPPRPLLGSFHSGLKLSCARPTRTVNNQWSPLQALFSSKLLCSSLAHSCIACVAGSFRVFFLFCFAVSYSRAKAEPNRNCWGVRGASPPPSFSVLISVQLSRSFNTPKRLPARQANSCTECYACHMPYLDLTRNL